MWARGVNAAAHSSGRSWGASPTATAVPSRRISPEERNPTPVRSAPAPADDYEVQSDGRIVIPSVRAARMAAEPGSAAAEEGQHGGKSIFRNMAAKGAKD